MSCLLFSVLNDVVSLGLRVFEQKKRLWNAYADYAGNMNERILTV